MTAPMFKVFTGAMEPYTASVDGVERKFIRATASSTVTDRKGHEFDVKALQKMGAAAKGMTIFLNHEYRVPEDLFGSIVEADAKPTGFDSENNAIWDLGFNVMVNEANPRAVQAWEAYEQGVRMGVSVGVIVKSWEKSKKDADVQRITDVEFLEASIVGIPANPRTWVQGAVKSINAYAAAVNDGTLETLDLLDSTEAQTKEADVKKTLAEPPVEETVEDEHDHDDEAAENKPLDSDNDDSLAPQEQAKSDEPTETSQPDAEELPVDSAPEVPAEGATPSAPDSEAEQQPEASVASAIDYLVDTYKTQVQTLTVQLATVTKERDEAVEASRMALSIVERISALPIGRKATYQREIKSFRRELSGTYDADFLAFLEREDS